MSKRRLPKDLFRGRRETEWRGTPTTWEKKREKSKKSDLGFSRSFSAKPDREGRFGGKDGPVFGEMGKRQTREYQVCLLQDSM